MVARKVGLPRYLKLLRCPKEDASITQCVPSIPFTSCEFLLEARRNITGDMTVSIAATSERAAHEQVLVRTLDNDARYFAAVHVVPPARSTKKKTKKK